MAFSEDYLLFVLDQLSEFGQIDYKKMFGGVGLYREGLMFGGIMGGELHLKVNDETRPLFVEHGMKPFFHRKTSKSTSNYYLVPIEIVEDKQALALWANRAYEVALKSKK